VLAQFQLVPPSLVRGLSYLVLFLVVAPLFPFLYVVMHWRQPDAQPGLGTYGALLYFRTSAILLTIAGAANLTYGIVSTTPTDPFTERLSWALLLGSGIFVLINVVLGRFLVIPNPTQARRVFGGFLMILSGLLAFFSIVMLFITLFWEPKTKFQIIEREDEIKLYACWTAYYLSTYLVVSLLLAYASRYRAQLK